MILLEHRTCEHCRWFRRFDADAGSGECESAVRNEYGSAYVSGCEGATLVVNAEHGCIDFEPRDSHRD